MLLRLEIQGNTGVKQMINSETINTLIERLQSLQAKVADSNNSTDQAEQAELVEGFSDLFSEMLTTLKTEASDLPEIEQNVVEISEESQNIDAESVVHSMTPPPISSARVEPEFKIKHVDAGTHPVSGRKLFSAHLIVNDDVVFKAPPSYSRAALQDELDLVMAEIKAEREEYDHYVKTNYGSEIVTVTPTGERIMQGRYELS